ncbi:MAG TPA: transglutaminase family protein [Kiritimatiellia bacterium]|nr:transglutaminase family protein [Kiritimatiellia bacterium]
MKKLWLSFVVILWAASMVWLIRYEAFPHLFTHRIGGYRNIFASAPVLMDSWMKILFDGRHIGYSHTLVDVDDQGEPQQYVVQNETRMNLNIMGRLQRVTIDVTARLDMTYLLREFTFDMRAEQHAVQLAGRRREDGLFDIEIESPAGMQRTQMEIPDDVVIHSALLEVGLSSMEPGDVMHVRTLDPATLSLMDMEVRALRREEVKGEPALVLASTVQGIEFMSWVDDKGNLLRQETPFGWVLEAAEDTEATAFERDSSGQADMLRRLAIPSATMLRDARSVRRLKVRLDGLKLSPDELVTSRQRVVSSGPEGAVLEISRVPLSDDAVPDPARYLSATPFVQSDHRDILARAGQITGGLESKQEMARAVCDWVYGYLEKNPSASLPSAIEVLRVGAGDCNEHTYLFVALARAAGIPARIHLGVVYLDGAFYYHAWPSVFVGRWVDMDPTFGQHEADASHIFLGEGESAAQVRLLQVVGQVKADILEAIYE